MTIWCLYYGHSRSPVAQVMPDAHYPGMWRVKLRGAANLSDTVNLSRAKDAASALAERGPPARNRRRFQWKREAVRTRLEAPYIAPIGKAAE